MKEYTGAGFGQALRSIEERSQRVKVFFDGLLRTYPNESDRKTVLFLEVGCCDGGVMRYAASLGFRVAGIDLPAVIEQARRNWPVLQFIPANVEQLSAEELLGALGARPQIIRMAEVIEHLVQDYKVLKTLYDVMAPGGTIMVDTPADPVKMYDHDHLRYYPLPGLTRLIELAGFSIADLGVAGTSNVVIGRKPYA